MQHPQRACRGLVGDSKQVKNGAELFCREEKWTKNERSFFQMIFRPDHRWNRIARVSSSIKLCEAHLLLLLY